MALIRFVASAHFGQMYRLFRRFMALSVHSCLQLAQMRRDALLSFMGVLLRTIAVDNLGHLFRSREL